MSAVMNKPINFNVMGVEDFGEFLYVVKVLKSISKDEKISIFADTFEVTDSGDLVFITNIRQKEIPTIVFAKGSWSMFYLAHPSFKYPMSVEMWKDVAGIGITYRIKEIPIKEIIIEKPVKFDEIETESTEKIQEEVPIETEPVIVEAEPEIPAE